MIDSRKRDSERDEPPEWWEIAYPHEVDERYWYDGTESMFVRESNETS